MRMADESTKKIIEEFAKKKLNIGDTMFVQVKPDNTEPWKTITWKATATSNTEIKIDNNKSKAYKDLIPVRVIFNPPATIVFWNDGTKTVVRCAKDEKFIAEVGVAEAIVKKVFGGTRKGRDRFLRLVSKATWQEEKIDNKK